MKSYVKTVARHNFQQWYGIHMLSLICSVMWCCNCYLF